MQPEASPDVMSNFAPTSEAIKPVALSPVESYFWRLDKDLNGAFRVAVLLRLEGCVKENHLIAALRQIQCRHPKLRAAITAGSDGRLRYHLVAEPPPIPFEVLDFSEEDTPWREETRRLLQREFPSSGPPAMVTVLRSRSNNYSELIFTVSHAIADGLSGIMLVDELLKEYAKTEANPDCPPCATLPIVIARSAKSSIGFRGRYRLFRRFLSLKRTEKRSGQTLLPEARDIAPQSQWMHWVFSREDTLQLVRRCRKEKTSLNGALVAAAYCGLMDCLSMPEALFTWQMPFNLREMLTGSAGPVTAEDLGCFVSNMNGCIQVTRQPDFWDLARFVHQETQSFVQHGGPSFGYNIASFFYSMELAIRRFFFQPPPKAQTTSSQRTTLLATSYGVVDLRETYGNLRPQGCTLIFQNEITGPSLVLEALVMNQQLNVGFAADDLEPAFWDRLQAATHKHFRLAATPTIHNAVKETNRRSAETLLNPANQSCTPGIANTEANQHH